jgi:regulator of protease activity HflC (stomatin/prohibitin superfamily)
VSGIFTFAIIVAAFTVGFAVLARLSHSEKGKRTSRGGLADGALVHAWAFGLAVSCAAFTCLLVFVSSFNIVGTRDIGIVTSFGALAGHEGPGPDLTAPWDNVTTIDDSYQLTDETFTVRIAGGQTAQATVQVRWNAAVPAADDIFANYKTTAGLQSGLLDPELNAATNTVLDGYDPITPLATGAKAGSPTNPSTVQLGGLIETALKGRVGSDINIATLNLKPLTYDTTVQNQINAATNQAAKTVVATEAEKTASAQAAANKLLEQNLANNPLVLVQQCMSAWAAGQITVPAGGSCWPGSGSGIVIPTASAGK